jgi:polyhydroxyalkanoate synthesis regulator phasin
MVDLLKKALYASMGLAFMTKEKIEETVKNLAKEARVSETEGRKLVEDMLKKSAEARTALEATVAKTVEAMLKKLSLPSRKEYEALENRITALEQKK